mmetsp:Transcript_16079/g.22444  ORF Transcript_16079/g.22444 Transcript_16079/m.22444 type:complete len:241 (-) Transcript_16079:370-1092(-)
MSSSFARIFSLRMEAGSPGSSSKRYLSSIAFLTASVNSLSDAAADEARSSVEFAREKGSSAARRLTLLWLHTSELAGDPRVERDGDVSVESQSVVSFDRCESIESFLLESDSFCCACFFFCFRVVDVIVERLLSSLLFRMLLRREPDPFAASFCAFSTNAACFLRRSSINRRSTPHIGFESLNSVGKLRLYGGLPSSIIGSCRSLSLIWLSVSCTNLRLSTTRRMRETMRTAFSLEHSSD